MSLKVLAETIDQLAASARGFVTETETAVTVSGLSAEDLSLVRNLCVALAWQCESFDSAENQWPDADAPELEFAPYRFVAQKPDVLPNTLKILTNTGFARWLQSGHNAPHWQIACIAGTIKTKVRVFQPWGELVPFTPWSATKSPRTLVRDFGAERKVPEDIRPWLADSFAAELYVTPSIDVWLRAAAFAILVSLSDELDANDGSLKFRGPPRLSLYPLSQTAALTTQFPYDTFIALQEAGQWVFENEREAEMRHILLATELARCNPAPLNTGAFLSEHMANVLEAAKIAYQMALADTSKDTLKQLSELRKAITDETSKLSDLSRQLMAAVASSLALGIGLVAARVAAAASPSLVVAVMIVAVVYVFVVILSGFHFIALQRQLREQWQPKLYRFLPVNDYSKMVSIPAARAERSFLWTSVLGGIAVLALAIVCIWPSHFLTSNASQIQSKDSKIIPVDGNADAQAKQSRNEVAGENINVDVKEKPEHAPSSEPKK